MRASYDAEFPTPFLTTSRFVPPPNTDIGQGEAYLPPPFQVNPLALSFCVGS